MRLLNLAVERFGPIRKASLELGPGLNVLYGPNDIGKSTLAEAIRAVLLLSHGSTESRGYVTWGADSTPEVTLTFQVDQEHRWRVQKSFGTGAKGTSILQRGKGASELHTEATGREVDGRLRALLEWGVAPPGGRGGQKGLPETYLSSILLGRQSEVASIFSRTLDEDPDESGKRRLTLALQALAQPELFRRVLQETQQRVERAFDSRGNPRRAKGSPFVETREQVNNAQARLDRLREELGRGEGVRDQLARLVQTRDELAVALEEARQRHDRAREGSARAAAIMSARAKLDLARAELKQLDAALEDVRQKEIEVGGARAAVERAEQELLNARTETEAAAKAERAAEEHLRIVTTERAEAVELQKRTLEARLAQLEAARNDAARRVAAAKETGEQASITVARGRELAQAEAELERSRQSVARVEAELRVATALGDTVRGREVLRSLALTEAELVGRTKASVESTRAHDDAKRSAEEAETHLQLARESLQRVQAEAGAQQRAIKEDELGRRALEAEAIVRDAEARAQVATEATAKVAQISSLERELASCTAAATRAQGEVAGAEKALGEAEARLDDLVALAIYMEWRATSTQREEAETAARRARELRTQAAELRSRAERIEQELAATSLPTAERLAELRALEGELRVAEAKVSVGLTVTVRARRPFELQASSDDDPPSASPLSVGEGATREGRHRLQLGLGDLADVTVVGGQEGDHEVVRRLRARWTADAEPLLRRGGHGDLTALEGACRTAMERRAEAGNLRQQESHLEAQARGVGDPEGRLQVVRQRLDELSAGLGSRDRGALEHAAADLGLLPPPGPLFATKGSPRAPTAILAARRKEVDEQVRSSREALERLRVAAGQGAVRMEGHAREIERARAAHALIAARLDGSAESVLEESVARASAGRASLASIAAERAALAREQSTALAEGQSAVAQALAERDRARQACADRERASNQARVDAASLEGQLGQQREGARGIDLPALERRLEEARTEARARGATEGELDAQRLMVDLSRERERLTKLEADVAARRATRDAAAEASGRSAQQLGGEWEVVLRETTAVLREATDALEASRTALAGLEKHRDTAIEEARARHANAGSAHRRAVESEQAISKVRDAARTALDSAAGQVEVMARHTASLDRSAVAGRVQQCQAEVTALPPHDPSAGDPSAADAAARQAEHALDQANQELIRTQGQLEVIGGRPLEEQTEDAERALERVQARLEEVELEYNAWKTLKEALEEAEKQQATHLGQALIGPVSERFGKLTSSKYGPLSLGPNLEAHGITARGELREIERLSVGTRDQLSAILRLTVAAQLQSALVLDDQLAQSDPRRLKWFSEVLRDAARSTQILVLTCRPGDYLSDEELPTQASTSRDVLDGLVRSFDLGRVIHG